MTSDKWSSSGGFGLDSIFELTLVCSSINLTLWLFIVLFRPVLSRVSAHHLLRTTPTCLVAHSVSLQRTMSSSHSPCAPTQPIGLSMTTQLQSLLVAPTAGLLQGPPGGLSDPDDDPNNDLPNLFNDNKSLPPSLPSPHGIPLPDLLLSCDPSPPIPDNDINLVFALTWAIHDLAKASKSNCDTSSAHTKVCKPDTCDGSDPHKLRAFLVQCELNFQDHPKVFWTDCAKVVFTQSYLKGIALEWFKLDLLNSDPTFHPLWMNDHAVFIDDLKANFGLHDPVRDAEHQLDHLSMKDGQHISKYIIKFNCLASQVHGYS